MEGVSSEYTNHDKFPGSSYKTGKGSSSPRTDKITC